MLLAAEVAGHLGPLLYLPQPGRRPYAVTEALLPFLMDLVKGDAAAGDSGRAASYHHHPGMLNSRLASGVRALSYALEKFEFHSCLGARRRRRPAVLPVPPDRDALPCATACRRGCRRDR